MVIRQYLVFQIDNSQQVLKKIATLYAEKLMNDICLVVDGIEFPAHRLILCTSSEVFHVSSAIFVNYPFAISFPYGTMFFAGNANESAMVRIPRKPNCFTRNSPMCRYIWRISPVFLYRPDTYQPIDDYGYIDPGW